jgi:DNA-binding NarL/FixJ family response regulator
LLIDVPRLLREIVLVALAGADDIDLVGELGADSAPAALNAGPADFAMLGGDDAQLIGDLLAVAPRLKLLTVIDDGRDAALYELRPQKVELGELSPERLVSIIREARPAVSGAPA